MTDELGFEARVRAARDRGVVHVELRPRAGFPAAGDSRHVVDALARAKGFQALGEKWRELTREEAHRAIGAVLHRDMAYDAEIMTSEKAASLAEEFLARFSPPAWFFTNGAFPSAEEQLTTGWRGSWDPITKATFDTGAVAVSDDAVGLLWVEDED